MQPGGDMSALLAQAQQMQQKLMEAQHQLANAEIHGQAGGGLVKVVDKGSGELVGVTEFVEILHARTSFGRLFGRFG